jgi:hypothetical protein
LEKVINVTKVWNALSCIQLNINKWDNFKCSVIPGTYYTSQIIKGITAFLFFG